MTEDASALTPAVAAELLAGACPSFVGSRWERTDGADPSSVDGQAHLRLTALALHVADLDAAGRRAEWPALFDTAEGIVTSAPDAAGEAVRVAFVEGLLCLSSHADGPDPSSITAHLGPRSWQVWHQGHERAEALSTRLARDQRPAERFLAAEDRWLAAVARATCFRAENGRLVSPADRVAADGDPGPPWLSRHAVLVGAVFVLILVLLVWQTR